MSELREALNGFEILFLVLFMSILAFLASTHCRIVFIRLWATFSPITKC